MLFKKQNWSKSRRKNLHKKVPHHFSFLAVCTCFTLGGLQRWNRASFSSFPSKPEVPDRCLQFSWNHSKSKKSRKNHKPNSLTFSSFAKTWCFISVYLTQVHTARKRMVSYVLWFFSDFLNLTKSQKLHIPTQKLYMWLKWAQTRYVSFLPQTEYNAVKTAQNKRD